MGYFQLQPDLHDGYPVWKTADGQHEVIKYIMKIQRSPTLSFWYVTTVYGSLTIPDYVWGYARQDYTISLESPLDSSMRWAFFRLPYKKDDLMAVSTSMKATKCNGKHFYVLFTVFP